VSPCEFVFNKLPSPINMSYIGFSRPNPLPIAPSTLVGDSAPRSPLLSASEPIRVIAFLRHVGCPFAENTVKQLHQWSKEHPDVAVFLVSHGTEEATKQWLAAIGGLGSLRLVVDPTRQVYAQWGLGYSHFLHFAGLPSLLGLATLLFQGIRNRNASGTRWQRAGIFLVKNEHVAWQHIPRSAQEFELPPAQLLNA
jgi:hypothetical protein